MDPLSARARALATPVPTCTIEVGGPSGLATDLSRSLSLIFLSLFLPLKEMKKSVLG